MSNELAPIIGGDVRRIEIAVEDETISRLSHRDFQVYCLNIRAIIEEAIEVGLTVHQFRDSVRMRHMIIITRGNPS